MSAPAEADQTPDPAEADRRVIDLIALFLAAAPDWGSDEITEVADLIALVRPHPGGRAEDHEFAAYAAALLARNDQPTITTPKENAR